MASPQKENGYTAIANEILDALVKIRIAGEHRQVLDFILRKTYGFNKKEDKIALSQFVDATGLKKPSVCRALRALTKMLIVSEKANGLIKTYAIQKDFDKWRPLAKKITLTKKLTTINEKVNTDLPKSSQSLAKKLTTKDNNNIKDNITKDISDVPSQDIQEFISSFKEVNPSYERLFANKTERAASERLLRKYGKEKMLATTLQLPDIVSRPYAPRITTPYELERNLGKLLAFVSQQKIISTKTETKIAFT